MDTIEAKTTQTAAATPTIPRFPTPEDKPLLAFAQQVEITMRDLYDVALKGAVFTDPEVVANINTLREAHEAYSQSLSGLLGRLAPNSRDEKLFSSLNESFAGDAASVASAAAELENVGVATHGSLVGQLVGTDGADLIASIMLVEARHTTVLRFLAGITSLDEQLADKAAALPIPTN